MITLHSSFALLRPFDLSSLQRPSNPARRTTASSSRIGDDLREHTIVFRISPSFSHIYHHAIPLMFLSPSLSFPIPFSSRRAACSLARGFHFMTFCLLSRVDRYEMKRQGKRMRDLTIASVELAQLLPLHCARYQLGQQPREQR